jgi:erythromycin esterase-like protein
MSTEVAKCAIPLTGSDRDFDALIERIGDARFVLIGEASHGTHEFYDIRARITRRLFAERSFHAVAVEADWPDAYRVNRYVHRRGTDRSAEEALAGFDRFPRWMWRNTVVADFAAWLRDFNAGDRLPCGFYGLDLYSLTTSRQAVIRYLEQVDPEAGRRARERYSCFDTYGDPQSYGYSAAFDMSESCRDEAVQQLVDLRSRSWDYMARDGYVAEDEFFQAEQNARLVKNAEEYYRTMFDRRTSSWNLRDRHMADTLNSLAAHLDRRAGRSKIVVWAHNSHLGDARATDMAARGELNLGQLTRESFPGDTFLIGFSTYTGTVMAADAWDGEGRVKKVRPAMSGSYEEFLHKARSGDYYLILRKNLLHERMLERAIGVIYRPETERWSHYFESRIADQFDAVIHVDRTRALTTLPESAESPVEEVPETFPSGV